MQYSFVIAALFGLASSQEITELYTTAPKGSDEYEKHELGRTVCIAKRQSHSDVWNKGKGSEKQKMNKCISTFLSQYKLVENLRKAQRAAICRPKLRGQKLAKADDELKQKYESCVTFAKYAQQCELGCKATENLPKNWKKNNALYAKGRKCIVKCATEKKTNVAKQHVLDTRDEFNTIINKAKQDANTGVEMIVQIEGESQQVIKDQEMLTRAKLELQKEFRIQEGSSQEEQNKNDALAKSQMQHAIDAEKMVEEVLKSDTEKLNDLKHQLTEVEGLEEADKSHAEEVANKALHYISNWRKLIGNKTPIHEVDVNSDLEDTEAHQKFLNQLKEAKEAAGNAAQAGFDHLKAKWDLQRSDESQDQSSIKERVRKAYFKLQAALKLAKNEEHEAEEAIDDEIDADINVVKQQNGIEDAPGSDDEEDEASAPEEFEDFLQI